MPTVYFDGPRVDNSVFASYCTIGSSSLEDAKQQCSDDFSCSFIHDVRCDGSGWRTCTGDINAVQAANPGTTACTQIVEHPPCTFTITTTSTVTSVTTTETTTWMGDYVDGPRVPDV